MKKFSHKLAAVILSVVLAGLFSPEVFAVGTTLIDLSTKNPAVGESVSMTITGSESSTITVRYNASVLNFQNCNVTGYVTEGNAVTFTATSGIVTFTAASAGSSNLIVSSDTLTGSSTSVTVSGGEASNEAPATDAPEETVAEEPTVTEDATEDATASAATDVPADYDFMVGDTAYVVSERFKDSEIPAGFEKVTLTIHEKTYRELQNGDVTLIYLKPAADTSGSGVFYFYDAASDTVAATAMLGTREDYILLMAADSFSSLLVPAVYTSEEFNFAGYQVTGTSNEFYYVYGITKDGQMGWYAYDTSNNTFIRANVDAFGALENYAPSSDADEEEGEDAKEEGDATGWKDKLSGFTSRDNLRKIIALLVLVLAIIIVIFINISVARRRREEEEDIFDDYDEEEGEDDEPYDEPAPRRPRQVAKEDEPAAAAVPKVTSQPDEKKSQEERMEQQLKNLSKPAASQEETKEPQAEAPVIIEKKETEEGDIAPVLIKPEDINPEFKDTPVSKVDNFETKKPRHKGDTETKDINLVDLNDL